MESCLWVCFSISLMSSGKRRTSEGANERDIIDAATYVFDRLMKYTDATQGTVELPDEMKSSRSKLKELDYFYIQLKHHTSVFTSPVSNNRLHKNYNFVVSFSILILYQMVWYCLLVCECLHSILLAVYTF
jgi:hypothetical protein